MEKSLILSQLKAFVIDALQEYPWVHAVLKSERHAGNASVGAVYTTAEGVETVMNNFDPLKSFQAAQKIQEFFAITQAEGVPRWNMIHFTLLSRGDGLTYEAWLDHRIDEEIRFYDAGGEVEEWQAIEDERDAFFQQGGSEEAWRSRIEQLISDRTTIS